jgi:hypothetical protein
MVPSQIMTDVLVIATKDNKIKLVNIEKGESYKTIPFAVQDLGSSPTYPLELAIIERESKPCTVLSI